MFFSYCVSLIMFTKTRHMFIYIFQTEHFSAVTFDIGYEKNMSVIVIPKTSKGWKETWNRTGLLKSLL